MNERKSSDDDVDHDDDEPSSLSKIQSCHSNDE
jgi:hypothetical protein